MLTSQVVHILAIRGSCSISGFLPSIASLAYIPPGISSCSMFFSQKNEAPKILQTSTRTARRHVAVTTVKSRCVAQSQPMPMTADVCQHRLVLAHDTTTQQHGADSYIRN
jgi:hypothetical protein